MGCARVSFYSATDYVYDEGLNRTRSRLCRLHSHTTNAGLLSGGQKRLKGYCTMVNYVYNSLLYSFVDRRLYLFFFGIFVVMSYKSRNESCVLCRYLVIH